MEAHLNQIFQNCPPRGDNSNFSSKDALLHTFEYLEQHVFFYSNILTNRGMPVFRERFLAMTIKGIEEQIDMTGINQDINKEIIVQYVASAAIGVIEWWITHSMPFPATYMVEQLWLLLERVQMVHR